MLTFVLIPVYSNDEVEGWAAIIEMNDFPENYSDINISFVNSERLIGTLISMGWSIDQIYLWNDVISPEDVLDILNSLDEQADQNDLVLLYIFTHGSWMSGVLSWNDWVPERWTEMDSRSKVMIVDSCNSGNFISPFASQDGDGIFLSACSTGEVSWAGLEEEGLPILGSVWEYYLTNSLTNSSADVDTDGWISVEEAFNLSVPLTQSYMMEEVFAVPEFLQMYNDIGIYPEKVGHYPNPVIIDQHEGQLVLDLSFYIPEGLCILSSLLPVLLILTKGRISIR